MQYICSPPFSKNVNWKEKELTDTEHFKDVTYKCNNRLFCWRYKIWTEKMILRSRRLHCPFFNITMITDYYSRIFIWDFPYFKNISRYNSSSEEYIRENKVNSVPLGNTSFSQTDFAAGPKFLNQTSCMLNH